MDNIQSNSSPVNPGEVYNRLTVLYETYPYITPQGKKIRMFNCSCSCGSNKIIRARAYDLKNHHTKSCGCLKVETINRVRENRNYECYINN
jgi:hypothetical protein